MPLSFLNGPQSGGTDFLLLDTVPFPTVANDFPLIDEWGDCVDDSLFYVITVPSFLSRFKSSEVLLVRKTCVVEQAECVGESFVNAKGVLRRCNAYLPCVHSFTKDAYESLIGNSVPLDNLSFRLRMDCTLLTGTM